MLDDDDDEDSMVNDDDDDDDDDEEGSGGGGDHHSILTTLLDFFDQEPTKREKMEVCGTKNPGVLFRSSWQFRPVQSSTYSTGIPDPDLCVFFSLVLQMDRSITSLLPTFHIQQLPTNIPKYQNSSKHSDDVSPGSNETKHTLFEFSNSTSSGI
jgi:hypothetical protein